MADPLLANYRYLTASGMLVIGATGLYLGGVWNWLGVAAFIIVLMVDVSAPRDDAQRPKTTGRLEDLVLYLPLPLIVLVWLLLGQQLGGANGLTLHTPGAVLSVAFLSALGGLPPSHELMHRSNRFDRFYASLYLSIFLLPMSDLGHVQGHHLNVATADDYDTPRRGQTVYTFAFRSLWYQMLDSFTMERTRLHKLQMPLWSPSGRFFQATVTVSLWLFILFATAGIEFLLPYVATMVVFYLVLGGFNYTQHYGLLREVGEPIAERHSWNQLKPLSRALSFEISNHSEHHLVPTKPYTTLTPQPNGPQLPSIILCFFTAFLPPIWERYIAKPNLKLWDRHLANNGERQLALAANKRAGWENWLER